MQPSTPLGAFTAPADPGAGGGSGQWPLFTQPPKPAQPPSTDDPNIIGVRKFVPQEPWLSFSRAGLRQADGLKTTLYLESGTTGKGAFGDGNLRVSMYSVQRDGDGEHLRLAVQWELTPEQSIPWRAKKASRLGWGYGLRLPWGDADVCGKEVEVVFQFLRKDGVIISAEPVRLRVPQRGVRIVSRDDAQVRQSETPATDAAPKSLAGSP